MTECKVKEILKSFELVDIWKMKLLIFLITLPLKKKLFRAHLPTGPFTI